MVTVKVTLSLSSALSLGESPLESDERVRQHIPGSLLRGAAGTALSEQCGHGREAEHTPDCEFGRVFLRTSPPRFSPAYPAAGNQASRPLPYTARTCKHYAGFRTDAKDEERHGIRDVLFASRRNDLAQERGEAIEAFQCAAAGCGEDLVRAGGYYERLAPGRYAQPRPWTQRLARTAIDRWRGTAADGRLYTLDVIGERMDTGRHRDNRPEVGRTTFVGYVWAEDREQAEQLQACLKAVKCLGGDTGRGLGAVEIDAYEEPQPPDAGVARERIAALMAGDASLRQASGNPDMVARLALFNAPGNFPDDGFYFSVDLLSDTVWVEKGLPAGLLPERLFEAERVGAFAGSKLAAGWNSAVGLMRDPRPAIEAGSVFLYRFEAASDAERLTTLARRLAEMEQAGIGLERERGCGWIQICAPFHAEVTQI